MPPALSVTIACHMQVSRCDTLIHTNHTCIHTHTHMHARTRAHKCARLHMRGCNFQQVRHTGQLLPTKDPPPSMPCAEYRLLLVHYADVVADPVTEMARVGAFLATTRPEHANGLFQASQPWSHLFLSTLPRLVEHYFAKNAIVIEVSGPAHTRGSCLLVLQLARYRLSHVYMCVWWHISL